MTPQPFFDAVKRVNGKRKGKVILMSPSGKRLTQKLARDLAKQKNLILLCGHYEGVDERVREKLVDESISIGDYVLTGGEIPAMVLIDCVTRLFPVSWARKPHSRMNLLKEVFWSIRTIRVPQIFVARKFLMCYYLAII